MARTSYLIRDARLINEGQIFRADLLTDGAFIAKIAPVGTIQPPAGSIEIEAQGKLLLPGVIDDQVHFREPGLTHKGEIYTESRAAVAGGVTSFMEMPNTQPQSLTQELLEQKYRRASEVSAANYSFYMGASNNNLEEVLLTNPRNVCGIKVFMGASTGNMLVDNPDTLRGIFAGAPCLVAVHCEDETIIRQNLEKAVALFGDNIPVNEHPNIRSREACLRSSSLAVSLAKEFGTRLHVLHISTADELALFTQSPLSEKRITAEVCVHHLWFSSDDYNRLGNLIKWNPAVKESTDRAALLEAVRSGLLDVVATDHAPHTAEEKKSSYTKAPSGGPLVQHSLVAMLELAAMGKIEITTVIQRMCHAPAELFQVDRRGYLREGYYADLVLVDPEAPWTVSTGNILYKCGWSPLEGTTFKHSVITTFVNGKPVFDHGIHNTTINSMRLLFNR